MHRVLEELKKVCTIPVRRSHPDGTGQVHPYEEVAYDVYKLEPF